MKKLFFILAALCAVLVASCNNSSSSPSFPQQPQQQVKSSDWLFLFYFDADDGSINDDLYKNIRDLECAFAQTRNEDGTPKDGYPSVTALLLWDGISEEGKQSQRYIHPDGALYEIGADPSLKYVLTDGNPYGSGYVTYGDEFAIGPNTKDLTSQAADWLAKEPNMSDPATFTNFLKWAKARYDATNVVVCLQDHGAGTYKETYTDSTAISKTLCQDATNGGGRMLTCKNITDALTASGWTGDKKPKILWNDLCLQGTAEILWNYKGCADYYCASPNVTWMPDYYKAFVNIKKDMSVIDVGKVLVSAYWARYADNPMPCPADEQAANRSRASAYSMYTYSFMSLDETKVTELNSKVEALAGALLDLKGSDQSLFNSVFSKCVYQDPNNTQNCSGLAYCGTWAWLNDLGWLCGNIGADLVAGLPDAVKNSADALQKFLKHGDDKLIVYAFGGKRGLEEDFTGAQSCWKTVTDQQTYLTGQTDFITKKSIPVRDSADCFGLTIVGSVWTNATDASNPILHYDDWTGFSSKWGQVINAWWEYSKSSN